MKIIGINEENFLPRTGIYYLYKNCIIVYIGQTQNLPQRIINHIKDGVKDFDSYSFLSIPYGSLDEREFNKIVKHKPIYNKSLPYYPDWITTPKKILKEYGLSATKKRINLISCNIEPIFSSHKLNTWYKKEELQEMYNKKRDEIHN